MYSVVVSNLNIFPCSLVPESPRWLISRNKYKEAKIVIKRMTRINKVSLPEDIVIGRGIEIDDGTVRQQIIVY